MPKKGEKRTKYNSDPKKTNLNAQVPLDIWKDFTEYRKGKGETKNEALTIAVRLYNNHCRMERKFEIKGCYNCGKDRKFSKSEGFESPCPHCGDEVPF